MTELQLLERIRRRVPAARGAEFVQGPGDDCAIFRPRGSSNDLLFTTDLLIEQVHFSRETHSAAAIGHKALARGLSDIAAMGGKPRFCLLSLSVPGSVPPRWIDSLYDGLLRLAGETGVALLGGDLANSDRVICDIVVAGEVPRGTALLRWNARPDDAIYVSGVLGGSALGLASRRSAAWKRHLKPEPRLALGAYLRQRKRSRAAMDLSDGLSIDLHRLTLASGVAAVIDRPLPIFHGASLEQALHGGEDYELLFVSPPSVKMPAFHRGIPLTRIGTIESGKPGRIEFFGLPLSLRGYDHFRQQ